MIRLYGRIGQVIDLRLQQVLLAVPWGYHAVRMEKVKDAAARRWYRQAAIDRGWSRDLLQDHIQAASHRRAGGAAIDFSLRLPSPASAVVQQTLQDPVTDPDPFDFLTLETHFHERELEAGLRTPTMTRRPSLIALATVGVTTVGGLILALSTAGTEHLAYTPHSLYHLLLTPQPLADLAERCSDRPRYVYRAADGPKPTSVTLGCTIGAATIDQALRASGFEPSGTADHGYRRGALRIEVHPSADSAPSTEITLFDDA